MVSNKKAKGTNAERELIHMFWKAGWVAARVAGSGSMQYPSPDIIAAKQPRSMVIESKVTSQGKQYLSIQEINDLKVFAQGLNAQPYVAVKFNRVGWYFLSLEDLPRTETQYAISPEDAKLKGMLFEELITI